MDRFSLMSFSADPPCSTHTDISLRGCTVSNIMLHCFTATQTGLQEPGDSSPSVRVSVRAHTHIHSGRHVCHSPRRDVSMWKSLGGVSLYVSLCPSFASHTTKLATFESGGKCMWRLLKLLKRRGFVKTHTSPCVNPLAR